ncbi:bifunctional riboflavin kinase/FAD synthetase [Oceanirhabdus sp. W0125-5]|uniref:bifunctional riboflavin kinase/FAD synthetase n=1 Tax=Oceanirhabdus sp. W0125-5 TaxID=2999116 RepID=UPI0022F3152F|nr:bifunctional riboflavin kinase/FAD synthetase [Oceanirhabdus sp. W0125-5]WBW94838.1 bifunctional riboflavin kinase/FAD synthetase [Oceanirhabdus sp. W0125-5]
MKILKDDVGIHENTVIVLGSFDGIHIGHRKLIETAIEIGQMSRMKSMVYTFANHPLSVINSHRTPKLLMSNKVKIEYFEKLGVDILALIEFNKEFMEISPEDFIKLLTEKYGAKHIIVGYNYRFGYKNLGDVELLRSMQENLGFELHVVEPVKLGGTPVSSTFIRGLIIEGEISVANEFLGHSFVIDGKIIRGKQIGRTIGFPTINLDYNLENLVPRGGVYYTVAEIEGEYFKGITNVGYNPTVNGNKLSIETYLLDFNKDVYDYYFKLHFIERIRDEKKFENIELLKKQIQRDKEYVEQQVMWF